MVEECQVNGVACVGSRLLDISVRRLRMRPAWMVEMHWLNTEYSTRTKWLGRSGLEVEQLTLGFSSVVLTVVNKRSVFI